MPISLRLVVDPPAVVTVNGRNFGTGRTAGGPIKLAQGTHKFTLTVSDFPTKALTRQVTATTKVISLTLEIGQLSVLVDPALAPPGGTAYLDGNVLGPIPLVRHKVEAGEHELVVRWNGTLPFRQKIVIPTLPNPGLRLVVAPPAG